MALLGLSLAVPAPMATAWDSFPPGADSHGAITREALNTIILDDTLPLDFRTWVMANRLVLTEFTTKVPFYPLGELVHGTKRPVDQPVDLTSCQPVADLIDLADHVTGSARWAVGNNPGNTHPEYWWHTAMCLWRSGHHTQATAVLGQLIHSISDQGAPPHAYYKMHGGIGEDQGFEYLSALTPYDNSYYRRPDSTFYPGKNVLDISNHGDGEYVTFHIPKRTGWTPIHLSPRSADSKPTYLHTTSPTHVRLDFAVKELTAAPKIEVAVLYEKADGSTVYKEATLQLVTSPIWAKWNLYDEFAPNGRLWVSFKRSERAYRASTGQLQVYVADAKDIRADVPDKPQLRHPWEYYEWLREWTQWSSSSPYWRRYFPGPDAGGDLSFDLLWATAPNSERALLTQQWAMSQQVTQWVLEDAYRRFNDPGYSVGESIGQGYRVAFYNDHNYNSTDDDSPEDIISYAIGCEPYVGEKCRSFVAPQWNDRHATVGDGIFVASGTGSKVTMKANTLPPMLQRKISSVEVRGATVYLYPGQDLTGEPRAITEDTKSLGDFNDQTQSIRIVPDGVTNPPTARDDHAATASNAPVTIAALANDALRDPNDVTIAVRRPSHGTVSVAEGKLVYTPIQDFTAPWPLHDSFSYEVTDNATGAADTAFVAVNVGGVNHVPRDITLDVAIADEPVTSSDEGQEITANATFVDEDAADTHTATITWGDGSPASTVSVAAGTGEFAASHVYRDNSPGVPFTLTATVTDSSGASASDSTTHTVLNVAPTVGFTSTLAGRPFAAVGIDVPVTAQFTDPGSLDTHTGSVDWGDGATDDLGTVSAAGLSATHAFGTAGTYEPVVTVIDKDGGRGSARTSVLVVTPAEASSRLAQRLSSLANVATGADRDLLLAAVGQLGSWHDGVAGNGAADLLAAGNSVAGLVKLGKAEEALRLVTGVDVAVERLLVAQTALSVAQTAARQARAAVGCGVPSAASCSVGERKALQRIDQYVSAGRQALAAGEYRTAIESFKSASGRALDLVR